MGTNTLASFTSGAIETDHVNQFFTALGGDFVPRQVVGAAAAPVDDTHKLGLPAYRWSQAHITALYLNGALFNPDAVGINSDWAIVSGRTRTTSDHPDFIRASGAGASATILATATNLAITAAGVSVVVTGDIALSSLTVAPAANNTALVNDAALTDQESSKYTGESINDPLTIDTAGTEITNRIGEYICLRTPDTEYMLAYVESATTLNRIYRGFFIDSAAAPIYRDTLANNDTLTIMSLGWVFLDNDGSTVDITYTTPIYSATEPSAPATDDYWFDLVNLQWNRYDGAAFQEVDRVPIGMVVIDGTNCVASRSFDFTKAYSNRNSVEIKIQSNTQVISKSGFSRISVYGAEQEFSAAPMTWDITTDLETGVTEAVSTSYYFYVTQDGDIVISDKKPFDRRHDLNGYYHPFNSWRSVGTAYNDASGNLVTAENQETFAGKFSRYVDFEASDTFYPSAYDIIGNEVIAEVIAGGGGGSEDNGVGINIGGQAGGYAKGLVDLTGVASVTVTVGAAGAGRTAGVGDGTAGGHSSFGSYVTAAGGSGGLHDIADATFNTVFSSQSTGGLGTLGDVTMQGAFGAVATSVNANGGRGWNLSGGNTNGVGLIVGDGGRSTANGNGLDGFRGLVRVWY